MSRNPRPGGKLREARAAGPTVDLDDAQLAKLHRIMAHRQIKSRAGMLRVLLDEAPDPR